MNKLQKVAKAIKEFLWNLAGFKKEIISQCQVDGHHASIIGTLLLVVGIYASLAWAFFFQTVTDNIWVPIIGGFFLGFFIVSFDRALIASMSTGSTNLYAMGFRLLLATLLGIFLAQPMILKFYQNDIKREAQILVDLKNQERKKELENLYQGELHQLTAQITSYQQQISQQQELLTQAENDFKHEMDGSGGTGRWGYNTVSKQKEKILLNHQDRYQQLNRELTPKIEMAQARMDTIHQKVTRDFETYQSRNTSFGTLVQVEALQSLLRKDPTGQLRMRYWLLVIILTLIELAALIAKLLFNTQSYSSKVKYYIETETTQFDNEKVLLLEKLENYKSQTSETDLETIQHFFTISKQANTDKLNQALEDWKNNSDGSYQELFELFKSRFTIQDK
jgi:hypothetical protein